MYLNMYYLSLYIYIRCDHPSQVELAQNDVVFCAGGVADPPTWCSASQRCRDGHGD